MNSSGSTGHFRPVLGQAEHPDAGAASGTSVPRE
jgi:hypothetical protein